MLTWRTSDCREIPLHGVMVSIAESPTLALKQCRRARFSQTSLSDARRRPAPLPSARPRSGSPRRSARRARRSAQGWPAIASGDAHADPRADRHGQDARGVPLGAERSSSSTGCEAPLANAVHILYISPLKALNNDVQRNLERPLAELRDALRRRRARRFPRSASPCARATRRRRARARMLRKTPHILITTPESLHICSRACAAAAMFSARARGDRRRDPRGGGHEARRAPRAHARAARDARARRRRSASGSRPRSGRSRRSRGFSAAATRDADGAPSSGRCDRRLRAREAAWRLRVVSPVRRSRARRRDDLDVGRAARARAHSRSARTTLVFVNNRAQAEQMAARINALAGEELALPYHGSLSRERRLHARASAQGGRAARARHARARSSWASTSARSISCSSCRARSACANGLQRVGRAGHTLDAVSRGVFVPTFRDDAHGAARRSSTRCATATSSRRASCRMRSTCWRRSSSPWWRSTTTGRAPTLFDARAARVSVSRAHARGVRRSAGDARRANIRRTSPRSSTRA